MDRAWARFQKHEPNLGVRDLYSFILNAAEQRWRPDVLPQVIDLAESMQDRDPKSRTLGNYRWYWHQPKPSDLNAVEFSMQTAGLTYLLYRDRLTKPAREKLEAAIKLGCVGMAHQRVDVSYTNIFLMRLANCILIGQALDAPDLVQQGRAWLEEWLTYTKTNGVHEFASPTYYGVDLTDLGAVVRYAKDEKIRADAERGLRLLWTEIAARWFEPYQGMAGAYSRDYGFLTGHGDLDQHLQRAGWNHLAPAQNRPALETLTHWDPPAALRDSFGNEPRHVYQRWGPQPWQQATTYVGRTFAVGSSGAGYGPQDRMLAVTLSGGPQRTILHFQMDHYGDPYGQQKILTSGDHMKLTHLLPFTTSVQRGPEVLMLSSFNPAGKGAPQQYTSVCSNLVFPDDVELWDSDGKLVLAKGPTLHPLSDDHILFLRDHETAVAICVLWAVNDHGKTPAVQLARDGSAYHAQRLVVVNSSEKPLASVATAVWIRAAEDLDDAKFAAFRRGFIAAVGRTVVKKTEGRIELSVPSLVTDVNLKLGANLEKEERIATEGFDPALRTGVLNVNGKDWGAEILGKE